MKGRISENIRQWLAGQNMKTRLTLAFSAAMVTLLLCETFILQGFIAHNFGKYLTHSAEKSCDQATEFLGNYLDTMFYVSNLIYYNNDIQSRLSAPDFDGNRSLDVQYREFLELDKVFAAAEMVENIYQVRIYIPDEISYSNHIKHFVGISQLKERKDYDVILQDLNQNNLCFTGSHIVAEKNTGKPLSIVSMLRVIRAIDSTMRPLAVVEVSIKTEQLTKVLMNSDITVSGLLCLINQSGQVISASGQIFSLREMVSGLKLDWIAEGSNQWIGKNWKGENYLVSYRRIEQPHWNLVVYIPEREIYQQIAVISTAFGVFSVLGMAAIFVVSAAVSRYYTRRLERLTDMMRQVQQGNWKMGQLPTGKDEISQLFYDFTCMTDRLKELMDQQYRSGKEVKAAQLKALQAQINPHFLYNTLDLINWSALDHDAPEIAQIAQSLARFYRISLNRGRQVVTIREELSHVEAYVQIENCHFDNAITLHIDAVSEVMELGCINLILQPLVENAIMHGIAENPSIRECTVTIRANRVEDTVVFTVEDDGQGMDQEKLQSLLSGSSSENSGYGVKNIQQRLQISYGEEYGLSYKSRLGKGTIVTIRIPARSVREMEEDIS